MPKKKANKKIQPAQVPKQEVQQNIATKIPDVSKLPKEAQEKLKQIKAKLEKFKKQVLSKFDKYIVGISLLPPPRPKEGEKIDPNKIEVIVLVDDSDSKRCLKENLKIS